MTTEPTVPVPLPSGEVIELPPREGVVIEVSARGHWRGGTHYREGELVEVPAHAVNGIVEASPPFGRVVDDLEAATAPDADEPVPEESGSEEEEAVSESDVDEDAVEG